MTAPLFEAENLSKRIGHHLILRALNFGLEPTGFTLLLGNNGAGKTTLLRVLCGLLRPSAGTLRFRGAPADRAAGALRRAVGVLSHEIRLYGDLTAEENLRLFGTLYGVERLAQRVPDALARVRLEHVRDIPVRTFSSGMTKRAAIARLLLCDPSVLLLDEPYSGLDRESLDLLDAALDEFQRGGGTVIMATHQFTPRTERCDRILILHQGTLVYNQGESRPSAERCIELLTRYAVDRSAATEQCPPSV